MLKMIDLGERRVLSEIIPKYVPTAGDECAILIAGQSSIVVTTDPVPPPAASVIGGDPDPYWMGWRLVVINASDLAAAGASPLGFLAAIECPRKYPVPQFERLLSGIKDACENEHLSYCGRNLREADKLAGVGTAVGWTPGRVPIARSGGQPGDLVVSVGVGGRFWRDALQAREGKVVDRATSPLFRPRSQMSIMGKLAEHGLIRAAMDNSDGLLPSLQEIANKNSCRVHIDVEKIRAASLTPDDAHIRYWMGWGDWNVIAVINPETWSELVDLTATDHANVTLIGELSAGPPIVKLCSGDKAIVAPRLESERFASRAKPAIHRVCPGMG